MRTGQPAGVLVVGIGRFFPPRHRVDVGAVGGEAGGGFAAVGDGAVAGNDDPIECLLWQIEAAS